MSKRLLTTMLISAALCASIAAAGCGSSSSGGNAGGGASASASTDSSIDQNKGGATAGGTSVGHSSGEEPPPIQVYLSGMSGIHVSKPTVKVVQSQKDWKALLSQQFSHGVKRTAVSGTGFDQKRQIVAVVFPESPKGTEASIVAVNEINGQIVVKAIRLSPGKGCKVSGNKPRPISIVDTRAMSLDKTPKLVVVNQTAPC